MAAVGLSLAPGTVAPAMRAKNKAARLCKDGAAGSDQQGEYRASRMSWMKVADAESERLSDAIMYLQTLRGFLADINIWEFGNHLARRG